MQSNTFYTPDQEGDFESPSNSAREAWENYIQFNPEDTYSPPSPGPAYSEILFNKPRESPEHMEEEELMSMSYNNDDECLQKFREELDFSEQHHIRRQEDFTKQQNEPNDAALERENSECSRCGSDEEEEDLGSCSTKGSVYHDFSSIDGDSMSYCDDNFSTDQNFDLEHEFKMKALELIQDRPDEEKHYINLVMPYLVESMKEMWRTSQLPLTDENICTIIKDLLYSKELLIGAERQTLRSLVEKEMEEQRSSRPNAMVTENDLIIKKRKEKKASKGNRNTSTLNHLNENYVSNVFQFARRNYPQDKEVQKIGNERNVSALNFRNLMTSKLTDGIMTRKAKARMVGSGRELIGNIEYWMKDGYFDQCNDREKYILYKEKALRDLALSGQY